MGEARARPWDVAAANWMATALAVADAYADALLIDVGSTTADVIPIAAGRVAATGHNDLERLLAGELVYTGVLRTNLAAIAPRVPIRGDWCPVASEYFAISADVHLVLGHLAPEAYDCPTPDGRPADGRLRARAHRAAGVLRRRPARRRRDRRDRRLPRTASRCARSRTAARRVQDRCRPRHPSSRSAPAPSWRARSPRAWGDAVARRTLGRRPPPRSPRSWRHACADRRQGRRRHRRRRAAGAVRRARRARGAPSR